MTRRELARAMRETIKRPDIAETPSAFIDISDGKCLVCALGAALVSRYGGDDRKADWEFSKRFELDDYRLAGERVMARLLGISEELASDVSRRHWHGESIESIAQWLESDPDWAEGWEDNSHV